MIYSNLYSYQISAFYDLQCFRDILLQSLRDLSNMLPVKTSSFQNNAEDIFHNWFESTRMLKLEPQREYFCKISGIFQRKRKGQ